jgi:hypothetical protein
MEPDLKRQASLFGKASVAQTVEKLLELIESRRGQEAELPEVTTDDRYVARTRESRSAQESPISAQREEEIHVEGVILESSALAAGYGTKIRGEDEFRSHFLCRGPQAIHDIPKRRMMGL